MKTDSHAKYDESKNRIYLVLNGRHDKEEAMRMLNEYARVIKQAKPGFTVLADVSNLAPSAPEIQDIHSEAVHLANMGGVKKVARVVGITPLSGMQISRIAHQETNYPSENFKTIGDAEAYLDKD